MQRSPALTFGDRSAATVASPSNTASSSENSSIPNVNGSKKRKRAVTVSCELCKKRKVKCDKVEPTCGWCARNGRVCEYKTKRKPGLRAGYGRELESKINRLESFIEALGSRVDNFLLNRSDSSHGREPPAPTFQSVEGGRYPETPHSTSTEMRYSHTPILPSRWPVPNSSHGMQYSRPADIVPTRSMVDIVSTRSMVDIVPTRSMVDIVPTRSMVDITVPEILAQPRRPRSPVLNQVFATQTALSTQPDVSLPPYDLLHTLVDLYFKHVNTWSPILERKVLFDTFFGPSMPEEADLILLHAIVATTLRFSKDPRLTPESRRHYYSISKRKVHIYGLEHSNVRALQALMVLSLDVLGTSNGPQGWNLLAIIARSIIQLGLNVEKNVSVALPTQVSITTPQAFVLPEPKSWVEDEERRRLCWMIFVLDRYATVATTAFDFTFNDEDIDRQLPCRYDLFSQNEPVETRWLRQSDRPAIDRPENLGSFSYHCEILKTLSRIHRFLRKPVDIGSLAEVAQWQKSYRDLDGELNTWLYSLPDDYGKISQLCHSDPSSKIANWIMLHAAFHTSVIRLHSSAAYPTIQSHIFKPSYTAMQKCLAAVDGLRGIAQDVVTAGMADLLGPPFAFSLWVSVRLLLVHGSITDQEMDPNISIFMATLERMGQYWEIAQRYTRVLSSILQQYQRSKHSSAPNTRIFGTMRSSAYNLSILLSQQRHSVIDASSTRTPTPVEIEYLDTFDFFNYPRLPKALTKLRGVPDSVTTPRSLASADGFLTSGFAMPTLESDWLVFRPPHD